MSRATTFFLATACTALLFGVGCSSQPMDEATPDDESLNQPNHTDLAAINYSGNRIAISVDGNQHDKDDWGATPMSLAILAKRGLQNRLVHFDYCDHLGLHSSSDCDQMVTSALDGATKFSFNKANFFNDETQLCASVRNLRDEINTSSPSNPLYIIGMGPMEVIWQAVNAANASKRRYVTVISHSPWNDDHEDTSHLNHTAADVRAMGVQWIRIANQNKGLATGSEWSPWNWLKTADHSGLRWVYSRMRAANLPDVSDAGMVYYLLTNDEHAKPATLKAYFGNWVE